jgi:hypothetical protein
MLLNVKINWILNFIIFFIGRKRKKVGTNSYLLKHERTNFFYFNFWRNRSISMMPSWCKMLPRRKLLCFSLPSFITDSGRKAMQDKFTFLLQKRAIKALHHATRIALINGQREPYFCCSSAQVLTFTWQINF